MQADDFLSRKRMRDRKARLTISPPGTCAGLSSPDAGVTASRAGISLELPPSRFAGNHSGGSSGGGCCNIAPPLTSHPQENTMDALTRYRAAQERNRNRLQSAVDPRRASWHRWFRLVRLHNALAVRIIGLSRAEA